MAGEDLERSLNVAFVDAGVKKAHRREVMGMLDELKQHYAPAYFHSIRVGLKAKEIAEFMNVDPKPALYGVLHDIGKSKVPLELLDKGTDFNEFDREMIKGHTYAGYMALKEKGYVFSAWLALTHHRHQRDPYPEALPRLPIDVSPGTFSNLQMYSRVVALADFHDALRRKNDRHGKNGLNEDERKKIMIESNKDQTFLVRGLYEGGVFE